MGLGKTLTMLSAIIASLADANDFATSQHSSGNANEIKTLKPKSTLVVVPPAS
jgi:hypothetical protein